MNRDTALWTTLSVVFLLLAMGFASNLFAQEVTYCKHAQTGKVIVIEKGYACPQGYYKI